MHNGRRDSDSSEEFAAPIRRRVRQGGVGPAAAAAAASAHDVPELEERFTTARRRGQQGPDGVERRQPLHPLEFELNDNPDLQDRRRRRSDDLTRVSVRTNLEPSPDDPNNGFTLPPRQPKLQKVPTYRSVGKRYKTVTAVMAIGAAVAVAGIALIVFSGGVFGGSDAASTMEILGSLTQIKIGAVLLGVAVIAMLLAVFLKEPSPRVDKRLAGCFGAALNLFCCSAAGRKRSRQDVHDADGRHVVTPDESPDSSENASAGGASEDSRRVDMEHF